MKKHKGADLFSDASIPPQTEAVHLLYTSSEAALQVASDEDPSVPTAPSDPFADARQIDYAGIEEKKELSEKMDNSSILIGENVHWRTVKESLLTFMTSKKMIEKHFEKLIDMATNESNPFEKNLHEIYEKESCFSPIPSLSIHCANINSAFGLSPNVDLKKLWNDNKS